jgi:hypothetical protein
MILFLTKYLEARWSNKFLESLLDLIKYNSA